MMMDAKPAAQVLHVERKIMDPSSDERSLVNCSTVSRFSLVDILLVLALYPFSKTETWHITPQRGSIYIQHAVQIQARRQHPPRRHFVRPGPRIPSTQ